MTLQDLWKLIVRFKKYVIAVPVICAVVLAAVTFVLPSSYQATATVTATGEAGAVGGIAETQASQKSGSGVSVSATTDASAKRVSIVAEGSSADACKSAANEVAQAAAKQAKESFSQQTFKVSEASNATDTSSSPVKIGLVGLFGALFCVICGIVIWDMVRRPIKSGTDASNVVGAPIFGELPTGDRGERILANIRFASPMQLETVSIVSVDNVSEGVSLANVLLQAAGDAGLRATAVRAESHAEYLNAASIAQDGIAIVVCAPLAEGMGAAYLSRAADVTVLVVREWSDSAGQLEKITNELGLADVQIDGIVMLPELSEGSLAKRKGQGVSIPRRGSSQMGRHGGQ